MSDAEERLRQFVQRDDFSMYAIDYADARAIIAHIDAVMAERDAMHAASNELAARLRRERDALKSFVEALANNPRKPATWMQTREAAAACLSEIVAGQHRGHG